ncbi:MAG: TrmH family RNA methyltransferase [Bacteroidetes bacterium]|nr:TrmH family RNA methyltransferase [Bacteroidota bacterium]
MPDSTDATREMQRLLARAQSTPDPAAATDLAPATIVRHLRPFLTERRQARIEAVLEERTTTVVPVVEGIVNTGNVSAVMRSAEALGFHQFHVIKNAADDTQFKTSRRTSQGAEKWLDVQVWDTPATCARRLRERGYRVVVTHLDDAAVPLGTLDFTQPTAIVFGNERDGASEALLAEADATCILPMSGFTQSFNISVAAALVLYHAREDRLRRQGYHGDLPADAQEALRAHYFLQSVNRAADILARAQEDA